MYVTQGTQRGVEQVKGQKPRHQFKDKLFPSVEKSTEVM